MDNSVSQSRQVDSISSMSNTPLVERLKYLMSLSNMNASMLAEKARVGSSFVYDILNGKSANPTAKNLSAVAEVLGVSVTYLLYGDKEHYPKQEIEDELVAIPSIAVEASMGGGAVVNEEKPDKPYYFHRSWVRDYLGANINELRIIFVRGDSMNPVLQDQDMILVNLSEKKPTPPGIFVLFDGIGLVVKRLEYLGNNQDCVDNVRIISDNPQYSDYERSLEEINIIGRVVWFARQLV